VNILEPNQGRLIYRENFTNDLAIFRFKPDNSEIEDFKPGQFVNLGLQLDEREITHRAYSLASPPQEKNYYEFYIKHKEHPEMGKFTTALFKMSLDESVYLQSPRGAFTIEEQKPDGLPDLRQMVLLCSGTGLAPFMSYIRYLKKIGSRKKIVLLHGVSFGQELGYRDILENFADEKNNLWNFTYIPTVSRPNDKLSNGWQGNTGRVESVLSGIEKNNSILEQNLGTSVTPVNSIFYLCGYKTMIDHVLSILAPLGFVDNRHKRKDGTFDIKYELYGV
jgi:ferredoxin/flavodoxin---NADP+ reductase